MASNDPNQGDSDQNSTTPILKLLPRHDQMPDPSSSSEIIHPSRHFMITVTNIPDTLDPAPPAEVR